VGQINLQDVIGKLLARVIDYSLQAVVEEYVVDSEFGF